MVKKVFSNLGGMLAIKRDPYGCATARISHRADVQPRLFPPCFLSCFLPPSPSSSSLPQQFHLWGGRSREGAAELGVFGVLGQGKEKFPPKSVREGPRVEVGGNNPKINHV